MGQLNIGDGVFLIDEIITIFLENCKIESDYRINLKVADEYDQIWIGQYKCSGIEEKQISLEEMITSLKFNGIKRGKYISWIKMGLYYLLKRTFSGNGKRVFYKMGSEKLPIELELFEDDYLVDQRTMELRFRSDDVDDIHIKKPFSGKLYKPKDGRIDKALIVLGGSTGGFAWSGQVATVLASHGYAALAFSYFDFRGKGRVPRRLEEIHIESFKFAIDWLKKETGLNQIGLLGISKGAESALLTASYFPDDIKAVANYVPSEFVFEGVYMGKWRNRSSWSYKNEPLSFIPYPPETKMGMFMKDGEIRRIHDNAINISDDETRQKATIPVGNIKAPVLLISAGIDATWPSEEMANNLKDKLGKNGKCEKVTHLNYNKAGHCFLLPNLPPLIDSSKVDVRESYKANRKAWDEVVKFFRGN